MTDVKVMSVTFLLDVLEIVIDSVMDPTFHMTISHTNHTNFCLTKRTVNCFEQALHAHQINKANHPETGKLCEYPALLQSFDGHHWQESTCEEIGRLAQGYPLWCLREPTLFFS